ncbi:MAG: hypothetical protein JXA10_16630, partial [Anaerolineae bacterium]|nr:hypothetical protein [Anaerolineae bacterium]
ILINVENAAPPNARIFTFGVGNDVDTFLLDQLVQAFRGAGTYVRPEERIDEEVSNLYNKISAPVLTNLELEVDGVLVEDMYPAAPLPDLFIGTQLIVVGRYRDGGATSVKLIGELDGEQKVYTYESDFRDNAGGEVFIPRLWATRKIGALLNAIRLYGEDPELVDSIVRLSIRYGIITPYTSFLITEDDIFSQQGREEAEVNFQSQTDDSFGVASGEGAVAASETTAGLADAEAPMAAPTMTLLPTGTPAPGVVFRDDQAKDSDDDDDGGFIGGYDEAASDHNAAGSTPLQYVSDRTFVWRDGAWVDTLYDSDEMEPVEVVFLSDEYFELLDLDPLVGEFLALGDHVLFVWDDVAYEVVPE